MTARIETTVRVPVEGDTWNQVIDSLVARLRTFEVPSIETVELLVEPVLQDGGGIAKWIGVATVRLTPTGREEQPDD